MRISDWSSDVCSSDLFGLAADLVDLVDIDDPAQCPLDVVIRRLEQLEDDILDILADIARLGQRRRIGHRERHVTDRSEERRDGKECVRTVDVRWWALS